MPVTTVEAHVVVVEGLAVVVVVVVVEEVVRAVVGTGVSVAELVRLLGVPVAEEVEDSDAEAVAVVTELDSDGIQL